VECKGIIGNDGRHYILDLLRTFPPDLNFLEVEEIELSKEATALGFPIIHKHKLCCLRQELIDAFVESRYMMFIKYAAVQLQQLGLKKQMDIFSNKQQQPAIKDESNNSAEGANKDVIKPDSNKAGGPKLEEDEAKKIVESLTDSITSGEKKDIEESTKDIVKKAAVAVGSLKETEFDIRFNPDVFSPGVKHKDQEGDFFKKQCQLVKDASDFLITVQIPGFIRDCMDHSSAPMDGQTLSDNLHNRGINIRYIGVIAQLATAPQLSYIHSIAVSEVIIRSTKHIFTNFMQGLELTHLSVGVAHFLNCFLSSCSNITVALSDELRSSSSSSSSRNKKRRNGNSSRTKQPSGNNSLPSNEVEQWISLCPKSLWKQINEEAAAYYKFNLNSDNVDGICEVFGLQKISLLRAFCQATGVQLLLKEYAIEANNNTTKIFNEEDVINIFPVVKHINPRATDAYNFYTTGQSKIQQGYLKDGYELISESLNLLNNVYGAMHPEIAQCLRMLARLNYIMGEHGEAMAFQQKAVLMSERVNGIDHPYTITEYTHLALYCFANGQITTSLKLLYRARYLSLLVVGENHPEVALIDSNIGLILHAVGEYEPSLKFLENALKLNIRFHGPKSLKVAVSYHLVARTQSCMGDFRSALQNERETFAIYNGQLGADHDKTKESSECLKHLTQQAVVLQTKMNEIYTGKSKTATLPPIQIQAPSMTSVLDMLNIINGILFVQISQRDIENFKVEIEKRQQDKPETPEDSPAALEDVSDHKPNEVVAERPVEAN
jgi:protein TIF31